VSLVPHIDITNIPAFIDFYKGKITISAFLLIFQWISRAILLFCFNFGYIRHSII